MKSGFDYFSPSDIACDEYWTCSGVKYMARPSKPEISGSNPSRIFTLFFIGLF